MVAVQYSSLLQDCTANPLEADDLNQYLAFSLGTGKLSTKDIINSVSATGYLGFDFEFIAATNITTAAKSAFASSESDCWGEYRSASAVVGFAGFSSEPDTSDYQAVATGALIEALIEDSKQSNADISVKIRKALANRIENENYWAIAVATYTSTDANDHHFFDYLTFNAYNETKFYTLNIAGKNLLVTGAAAGTQATDCNPALDVTTLDVLVETAIANSGNNATNLVHELDKGDDLIGFESELIIAAYKKPGLGLDQYTYPDCTFKYTNADWQILYYGLPIKETTPTVPTTQPTVPTTQPSVPTTQPTVPTTQPTVPTTQPTVPTTHALA